MRKHERPARIGIVGGGPGGLMTAYRLEQLCDWPIHTTMFEASPRLGGKIRTETFANSGQSYEAGAAEFYDYSHQGHDPLKELVRELGLPTQPMGGPVVVMQNRVLANMDDLELHFGAAARQAALAFDVDAKNRQSPREFYHSGSFDDHAEPQETLGFEQLLAGIGDADAQTFVRTMIHSDLAAEPHQTNVAYGLQNYLMNSPAYMRLYGIIGGNERLPQELARRLAATVLLEQRVESVSGTNAASEQQGQLSVRSSRDGVHREDSFDYVVIALPHDQCNSIHFVDETLRQAVAQHHRHYDHPAHYLRITILFERPFWRQRFGDSYWMLDAFGGCCLYDESSRDPSSQHGVLGWLLGGDAALAMCAHDDDTLVNTVLDALPDFFDNAMAHSLAIEARVHRWPGAVSALPGGRQQRRLDQRHQPSPRSHPRMFFVGDYMFDSTLNGALDSADYVASWIAANLADATVEPEQPTK